MLGFISAQIDELTPDRFALKNYGELRTFRFPETSKIPDYRLSKNIIGHELRNNHLYVFLGPESESVIELTSKPQKASYLKSLNGQVVGLKKTKHGLELELESHIPLSGEYVEKGEVKKIQFKDKKGTLKVGAL